MPLLTFRPAEHLRRNGSDAAFSRIARLSALFAGSTIVRAAAAFLLSVVVARGLGAAAFGTWALCTAWAGLLTFALDLGFGVLITRDAAADRAAASRLVLLALTARAVLFVPLAVAVSVAAPRIGLAGASSLVPATLMLAAAGVAYGSLASVLRAWPERIPLVTAIETAGAAGLLAGACISVAAHGGVAALLWLAAAVQLIQLAAATLLTRTMLRLESGLREMSWQSMLALARRASVFAVSGIVANVQERLGTVTLGYVGAASELALFGAAWRIGLAARFVPQAAFGGGLPVLVEEASAGATTTTGRRFERALGLFAIGAALLLIVLGGPIARLAYGDGFEGAAQTVAIVGLWLVPFVMNSARKVALYAAGMEQVAMRVSVATLAVQIAASLALAPRFGASGAALALAAGECVMWWPLRGYRTRS
jgi:O-antigen/teichoic acid export membrane protein